MTEEVKKRVSERELARVTTRERESHKSQKAREPEEPESKIAIDTAREQESKR